MSQPQSPSEDAESDHRQQQHQTHPASPSGGENDHQSSHLVNDQQRQASEPDMQGPDSLEYDFEVKEQDRWLPIANVARIMKGALPENAKIAKEAKECMQECVSEFISFITSEASEKCHQEKRKTVNGEDILFAMTSLGFENYGEALKIYLARYRENLNARGETNRPAGTAGANGNGANNATTSPFNDASGNGTHAGLSGGLDQAADSTTDFAYSVGAAGNTDY